MRTGFGIHKDLSADGLATELGDGNGLSVAAWTEGLGQCLSGADVDETGLLKCSQGRVVLGELWVGLVGVHHRSHDEPTPAGGEFEEECTLGTSRLLPAEMQLLEELALRASQSSIMGWPESLRW